MDASGFISVYFLWRKACGVITRSPRRSAACTTPPIARFRPPPGADLLLDSDDESVVGADCSGHPMRSNIFLGCLSTVSSCLKNTFVLVQITRFQQIIGVYTLQAPSEAAKVIHSSLSYPRILFSGQRVKCNKVRWTKVKWTEVGGT